MRKRALRLRAVLLCLFALSVLLFENRAFAQPDPAPDAAPPAEAKDDSEEADAPETPGPGPAPAIAEPLRDEAKGHFVRGVELFKQEAWTAALAEFLRARELYPSRSATKNAAICLRKLERYDEALEMFEELMRDFDDLPPEDKELAQVEIADLRTLVASLEVEGAQPGSLILVDGEYRGDYPLLRPLRVSAGSHVIRVFKEGFEPYETRIDVAGGQRVDVEAVMPALTDSGRLRVSEKSGAKVSVLVDGAEVGTTPWEGLLAVGDHVVQLKGEGILGSEPASANVRSQQLTTLTLEAEPLEADLTVVAQPAGATVYIDSVAVGRGIWQGPLKKGPHQVEVANEGFVSRRESVSLAAGESRELNVALERDPDAAMWQKPSRIGIELEGGPVFVPTTGGDISAACDAQCDSGIGAGAMILARGDYEFGSGLALGLFGGWIRIVQTFEDRAVEIEPQGLSPRSGRATDEIRIQGVALGASVAYGFGDTWFGRLRLGAGALIADVRDVRDASFTVGSAVEAAPQQGDSASTVFLLVDPEARFGVHPIERLEISIGAHVMTFVATSAPRYGQDQVDPVVLPEVGYSRYPEEQTVGDVFVGFVPSIGARYAF